MSIWDLLVPDLQGHEPDEHRDLVAAALARSRISEFNHVTIEGQDFSLGEISAIAGDFCASPDHFIRNIKTYRKLANWLFKENRTNREIVAKFNQDLPGVYVELARRNFGHFRHGIGDDNALALWKRYHDAARRGDRVAEWPIALDSARINWAFGAHYMMDSCSSGHMRTPRGPLYRHFTNKQYVDEDALNAAAALSGILHERDCESGVWCTWIGVERFTDTTFASSQRGKFLGDGHVRDGFHLTGSRTPETSHLIDVVYADFDHAFSKDAMWHGLDTNAAYQLFLDRCLPQPEQEDVSKITGETFTCTFDKNNTCYWHGKQGEHKTLDGNLMVHVQVNDDRSIAGVLFKKAGSKKWYPTNHENVRKLCRTLNTTTSPKWDLGLQLWDW